MGRNQNPVVTSLPVVDNAAIVPATTPAPTADKMSLKVGQSYTIVNDHFGDQGAMAIAVGGVTFPVRVDNWSAEKITFTLPVVGLDKPTDGSFQIAGADHNVLKSVPVLVVAQ